MLNNVCISGRLGHAPETFYGSEGQSRTTFSFAFLSGGRDHTSWIRCVCFNKTAEIAEKYLHTGARIAVTGYLKQNTWETDQGERKSNYEIIVTSIEFIKVEEEAPYN